MNKRVAIVCLGSRGDFQPFVALASALQEEGAHVRLYASEEFHKLAEPFMADTETVSLGEITVDSTVSRRTDPLMSSSPFPQGILKKTVDPAWKRRTAPETSTRKSSLPSTRRKASLVQRAQDAVIDMCDLPQFQIEKLLRDDPQMREAMAKGDMVTFIRCATRPSIIKAMADDADVMLDDMVCL
jgi:hypothetical protein